MPEADLVIVGCGPVGAYGSARARQHGLSVIALDRSESTRGRAVSMDDEIQRLFATAGLLDGLRSCSSPFGGAEFLDHQGHRAIGIELPVGFVGPNGHPRSSRSISPPWNECCVKLPSVRGPVDEAGADVAALDGNKLTLSDGATITGRWVLGRMALKPCVDRLVSSLRTKASMRTRVVVDTTLLDPDLSLSSLVTQYCDPDRIVTYIPGHGTHRRWEFQFRRVRHGGDGIAGTNRRATRPGAHHHKAGRPLPLSVPCGGR